MIAILVFVVAVVTVLVFQTVVINICVFVGLGPKESTPITLVAGHVGLILVFGLWYAFGLKKFPHARKSMKKVATPGNLGGLLLLSLGLSFFMSFGLLLVNPIIPEEIIERYIEMMEIAQLGESVFTNFAGCFLAPIGEELIFRGVMLYFLLKVIKGLKRKKVLFWVVNLVQAGDLVVTQDYGLAAMCLARKAQVVSQNGLVYHDGNIDQLLFGRYVSKKIRNAGGRLKGPAKRTAQQDEAFARCLEELLQKWKSV